MNNNFWWHRLRANFLLFINRRAQAMDALETALAIDNSDTAAKITLGVLYGEVHDFTMAAKHFQSALRDEPENANTLFNLGFIQQKQQAHIEAIESFNAAIRIAPALDRAWFGRGMSRAALDQQDQAIIDFEQAAKLQPMNPHALLELGMQYHATNNPNKVSEVIKRLREFDPKAMKQLMQATQTTLDTHKN
jgi:tetratricopeptide (TPR) repeat protein